MKTARKITFDDQRDAALLAFLDTLGNRSAYVREALREKMARDTGSAPLTLEDVMAMLRTIEARLSGIGDVSPTAEVPDDIRLHLNQLGL